MNILMINKIMKRVHEAGGSYLFHYLSLICIGTPIFQDFHLMKIRSLHKELCRYESTSDKKDYYKIDKESLRCHGSSCGVRSLLNYEEQFRSMNT